MAVPRVKDFLRIGGRNGRHLVGTFDGTLHEVDVAVILENVGVLGFEADDVADKIHAVGTLILNVVNRENSLDTLIPGVLTVHRRIEYGRQCRLPVVAVNDVRLKADMR